MKKLIPFAFVAIFLTACDENGDLNPVTIELDTTLSQSIKLDIPKTSQGNSNSIDKSETIKLSDYITNVDNLIDVKINSLSYAYKANSFTGSNTAVINAATLEINGKTISNINNVNPSVEVANNTTVTITDSDIINQIESILLNNTTVTIRIFGNASSDDGSASFEITANVDITATL